MWEKFTESFVNFLTMSVKLEKHEKEIDELKSEVKRLSELVQILISEMRNAENLRQSDREYIQVWIEKEMLKFERRLPSGKEKKDDEK